MSARLPSSWLRVDAIKPWYHEVRLPISGHAWLPFADIPRSFDLETMYEDLNASFPGGFVIKGCPPEVSELFVSLKHDTIRTGIDAQLDLSDAIHFEGEKIVASLKRGGRHGTVEEISIDLEHSRRHLEEVLSASPHAGKPQLKNVFRIEPSRTSRCFAFRSFSGKWLAFATLSRNTKNFYQTEMLVRDRNAPGDIMECLIAEMASTLRSEGVSELSLGEVPFMLHPADVQPLTVMERLVFSGVKFCRHAYDYQGLYFFKNKFRPAWRTLRLCGGPGIQFTPLLISELACSMGFVDLLAHSGRESVNRPFWPWPTQ